MAAQHLLKIIKKTLIRQTRNYKASPAHVVLHPEFRPAFWLALKIIKFCGDKNALHIHAVTEAFAF